MSVPTRRAVTVTFSISGQAMTVITGSDLYQQPEVYDPGRKEVLEASEALHYADVIKRGRGESHQVVMPPAAARVVMEYCEIVGKTFKMQSDLATRRDGDALLLVADRIGWKLKELRG